MKYAAKKLSALIITLFMVSVLAFLAFQIIPGDPTTKMLGTEATPEAVRELRAQLGLDRPVFLRYGSWLAGFLSGDMGTSYSYQMPVADMIGQKLPVTALLTALSFVFTVLLSIPLGVLAGSVRNRFLDRAIAVLDQLFMSIPPFFLGILMCYVFGILFRLFVPGDFVALEADPWGCIRYLVFPALAIAIPRAAMTVKMLRSSVAKELRPGLCLHSPKPGQQPHSHFNAPCAPQRPHSRHYVSGCLHGGNSHRQHHHRAGVYHPWHWAAAPGQHFQPGFPRGTGGGGHFGRLDRGRELFGRLVESVDGPPCPAAVRRQV